MDHKKVQIRVVCHSPILNLQFVNDSVKFEMHQMIRFNVCL